MGSRRLTFALTVVTAVLLSSSCDYRNIDMYWYESCELTLLSDWTDFPDEVTGMTVIFYPRESGRNIVRISTNDVSQVKLSLPVGTYDAIVFNQSENEFGSLTFKDMDNFGSARACLDESDVEWAALTDGQIVGCEPDWLGVAVINGFTVTHEMVDATLTIREIDKEGGSEQERERAVALTTVSVKPRNVVFTGTVNVKVCGYKYIRSMRGVITGMADSYYLGKGISSSGTACHALSSWTPIKGQNDQATTSAVFRTFGLPGTETQIVSKGDASSNLLSLSLILIDGKTVCDYGFNVGNRIVQTASDLTIDIEIGNDYSNPQEPGTDLDVNRALKVPEVKEDPGTGGGGFSATVDDWGEEQKVDVDIK